MTETDTDTSRSGDARRAERVRARRRRNLRVLAVLVVALGLVVAGAWQLVLPMLDDGGDDEQVSDYPGPGTGQVDVVIEDPAPAAIADVLVEVDVVATADAFVDAYEATPSATGIGIGSYVLPQQMAADDAVLALLDPANRSDRSLTIPAGWRLEQIVAKVAEVVGVPPAEVEEALDEVTLPDAADGEVEGWLAAGSYTVAPAEEPLPVLQRMVDRTGELLEDRGVEPGDARDVLVQASIVEAEVTDADTRGQVARVMRNRLAGCADVGEYLQMNSTVAYGLGKSVTALTLADLEDASTPYNTYAFEGLPPTPINSPSEVSLDAVLDPPDGSWCYFVTVDLETGETRFTDDPAEHERNRTEYQEWLAEWQAQQGQDGTDGTESPEDGG
jgi:UPF0755 protein